MEKLVKYSLIVAGLYAAMRTVINLFFYDQLPIAFLATDFNPEQMSEYRARVVLPAFFLTLNYFIYRHFTGKNPTSPLWPIYVISIAFAITQIIGLITFLPLTKDTITMFCITLFMCFVVRQGHNKRKNEIL
tara:strand:- start:5365 stop:5760 length:396 start_codon:yes stop_codon:yes gene_type:complete